MLDYKSLPFDDMSDTVYNTFLSFFNMDISLEEMGEKLDEYSINIACDYTIIRDYFFEKFRVYATKTYGVNIEDVVASSKLYEHCYKILLKYAKDYINVREYLDIINNMGIRSQTFYSFVKKYTEITNKPFKIEPSLIMYAKLLNKIVLITKDSETGKCIEYEKLPKEKTDQIYDELSLYANYEIDGLAKAKYQLDALITKSYSLAPKYIKYGEVDFMRKLFKDTITAVRSIYINKASAGKREQDLKDNQAQKERELLLKKEAVKDYLSSGKNVLEYVKEKGITLDILYECTDAIKECDSNLYGEYLTHKSNDYASLKSITTRLGEIANLIMLPGLRGKDGKWFNIVDLYEELNILGISSDDFITIIKELYKDRLAPVTQFINRYTKSTSDDKAIIINMTYEYNGRTMTLKEKEEVFGYIEMLRLPVTVTVFQFARSRCIPGSQKK